MDYSLEDNEWYCCRHWIFTEVLDLQDTSESGKEVRRHSNGSYGMNG